MALGPTSLSPRPPARPRGSWAHLAQPSPTGSLTGCRSPTLRGSLLYLTDCRQGGETLLLETLQGDSAVGVVPGPRKTLERIAPLCWRLLLMPHACPHAAAPVVDAPKLLLRGEVMVASDVS